MLTYHEKACGKLLLFSTAEHLATIFRAISVVRSTAINPNDVPAQDRQDMYFQQGWVVLRKKAFFWTAWKRVHKVCVRFAVKFMESMKTVNIPQNRYRRIANVCKVRTLIMVCCTFAVVGDKLSHWHLQYKFMNSTSVCDDESSCLLWNHGGGLYYSIRWTAYPRTSIS